MGASSAKSLIKKTLLEKIKPFFLLSGYSPKRITKDFSLVILGSAIVASAYSFFTIPNNIVPGGVYGIATVINHLTVGMFSAYPKGLPVGTIALCFNIPLWIAALRLLGPTYGLKTVVTFILTGIFTNEFSQFLGLNHISRDPLLCSVYAGVLIGLGVSIIFSTKATFAGTDVLAKIISKYTSIPVGTTIMIVDSTVVLLGLVAFGSWEVPLYSWITIFVYGKVVDVISDGVRKDKAAFIISTKPEELKKAILFGLNKGGTILKGEGLYSGEEKNVIYTIVSRQEAISLREIVNQIDPDAFLSFLPAHETLGKGFKNLNETVKDAKS